MKKTVHEERKRVLPKEPYEVPRRPRSRSHHLRPGATIAVIDSGVDGSHKQLSSSMWRNPQLKLDGPYALAINGWNFSDNSPKIFDPSLLQSFTPDVKRYSELSAKAFLFEVSAEEKEWAIAKGKEEGFMGEVQRFGTYVHGTHVAGIAMKGTRHKIMGLTLLAVPAKAAAKEASKAFRKSGDEPMDPEKTLKYVLANLAMRSSAKLKNIGKFIKANDVDIANGSFGTGVEQAAGMAFTVFEMVYKRKPTSQELALAVKFFLEVSIFTAKEFVAEAPKTLFVFAAGNDGFSNDIMGTSPANVKADNAISVAATYQDQFFAPFSNFGVKTVDLAAPGMLINSSIPGNDYLSVSGTSQAAPLVARIAGLVKDANPALSPKQIKEILMGTVDKKDFLKIRVASGGIVNEERALFAASLSRVVSVTEAISRAHVALAQKGLERRVKMPDYLKKIKPIPMPSMFE